MHPPESGTLTAASAVGTASSIRTHASIAGIGSALPATRVDNAAIAEKLGLTSEWFTRRTGVRARGILQPDETLAGLAAQAGREALQAAGVQAADLDSVIVATCTPDQLLPHCAPMVALELGAQRAGAFDVGAACAGFIAALQQGAALIETGRAQAVLVIGAERLFPHSDPLDKRTAALFGDGAGAVVLVPGGERRIGATMLGSDAGGAGSLYADHSDGFIRMDGHEVFQHAVARMGQAALAVLEMEGMALDDVDLVVPHQANTRIVEALVERLHIAPERVIDCIADIANVSAASIPVALVHAQERGLLPTRGTMLFTAFGAGYTWGAALVHCEGEGV